MTRTYVFKKPKDWTIEKWKELIILLSGAYPLDAGQVGPNDYEMEVKVEDENIITHIKSVCGD